MSLTVRDFALGLQETRTIRYDPICKTCSSPVTLAQKMINSTTTLGAISAVTAQNQEYHQQKLAFLLGQIWFVYHHRTNSQFLPRWTESSYSSRCFLMEFWGKCRVPTKLRESSSEQWGNQMQFANRSHFKTAKRCNWKCKPRHGGSKCPSRANIGPKSTFVAKYAAGQTSLHAARWCETCASCFLFLGDEPFGTHWHAIATSPVTPRIFSKAPHVLSGRNLCHKKHVCWGCSLLQGPLCQSCL